MGDVRPLVWLLLIALSCLACGDDEDLNASKDAGQSEEPGGRGGAGGRAGTAGRAGSGGRAGGAGTEAGVGGVAGVKGVAGAAGVGGAAGASGVGGRTATVAGASGASVSWPNCRAAVRGALSEWCAMDGKACEVSFDERLRRVCQIVGPAPSVGTAAFVSNNDCGGRSVNYVLGVDAYNATHHYDAAGKLIGVTVSATPCSGVSDIYGMACKLEFGEGPFDCSMFDADAGS